MPCYRPLKGYRSRSVNPTGKRSIVFTISEGYADLPVEVPCGQCIGCRLERSRQWAIRCVHECSLHEQNCFITLTYDNAHVPPSGSLNVKHYQDFMKRLRYEYKSKTIRFFHCGEYGEKKGRPHYHAILFGHDFEDKELHSRNYQGDPVYTSEALTRLWGKGHCLVGAANFETAAYVARYITKKVTGHLAEEHYERVDEAGEVHTLKPEYTTMSRRPGIAADWIKVYDKDTYKDDFIVLRGIKMHPPKAYDKYIEKVERGLHRQSKSRRRVSTKERKNKGLDERLEVRERIQTRRAQQLKRSYESDY